MGGERRGVVAREIPKSFGGRGVFRVCFIF